MGDGGIGKNVGLGNSYGYGLNSRGVTQSPYSNGYSFAGQRTTNAYQKWWQRYYSSYFQNAQTTVSPNLVKSNTASWLNQYTNQYETTKRPSPDGYSSGYSPGVNDGTYNSQKSSYLQPTSQSISNNDVTAMSNYRQLLESNLRHYIDQIKEKEKVVNDVADKGNGREAESGNFSGDYSYDGNDFQYHSKHSKRKHKRRTKRK